MARDLSRALAALRFAPPVAAVYDPLRYAWAPHEAYLRRFGAVRGRVLLLGMNPGPFGMAQTGVPFGDVAMVRDWMGIRGEVGQPEVVHPARPIEGFACGRSEVSGTRLWGWARDRYGSAEAFFEKYFVLNYCPLCFMSASGSNVTPDKLPAAEREPLYRLCDEALGKAIAALEPRALVGVGGFAEAAFRRVAPGHKVGRVLHPSPASPVANRGWAPAAERDLASLGLDGVP